MPSVSVISPGSRIFQSACQHVSRWLVAEQTLCAEETVEEGSSSESTGDAAQ
jgi:hypothetical protein